MISPIFYIYKRNVLKTSIPLYQQFAQAHRKPLWLPVAKSKIFRIPKRPEVSEEERNELKRVTNNYKVQMRAIRQFYHNEVVKEKSSRDGSNSEESLRLEAEEWEQCMALNEKWNTAISLEREKRRQLEFEEMEKYMLARMEAKDLEMQQTIEKVSAEIKKQKELSSTFITPEKLDTAIDYALANPTDYNYALDLKGQKHRGWEAPYERKTEKERITKDV